MNDTLNAQPVLDDKSLFNLALLLTLILSVIALVSLYSARSIREPHPAGALVEELSNPFDSLSVIARAAIVVDVNTGKVFFEKNADEVLPLASITKIMTAVTALDIISESAVVTIDQSFLASEGDSGLLWGEQWELKDLLDLSLAESSNDAATAIAGVAGLKKISEEDLVIGRDQFIKIMNEKAASLQMNSARFYNETGLDINTSQSGAYASIRDLSKLFAYAVAEHPAVFEATKEESFRLTSESNVNHTVVNTNKSVNKIPNIIASKTGYTDLAGGNLGIVFEPGLGNPIAVIVLGSTIDGRFSDVEKLTNAALEYLRQGR